MGMPDKLKYPLGPEYMSVPIVWMHGLFERFNADLPEDGSVGPLPCVVRHIHYHAMA